MEYCEGPAWSNVCVQGWGGGMVRVGDGQVNQRRRRGGGGYQKKLKRMQGKPGELVDLLCT